MLPIKRVSIFGFREDREDILQVLQNMGIVHIDEFDFGDDFKKENSSKYKVLVKRVIDELSSTLDIIKIYSPKLLKSGPSFFVSRKVISQKECQEIFKGEEQILGLASRIVFLDKQINQKKIDYSRILSKIEAIKPWKRLDVPLAFSETRYTCSLVGSIPKSLDISELSRGFSKNLPDTKNIEIKIISSDKNQTCVFIICTKKDKLLVLSYLSELGFAKPQHSFANLIPKEKITELEKSLSFLKLEIADFRSEILSAAKNYRGFMFLADFYSDKYDKYKVVDKLSHTRRVFLLSGYVPERDCKFLKQTLCDKFCIEIDFEELKKDEDAPVILDNPQFVSILEPIVESFSLPKREEIDPTLVMSIFYYILFGLMLSDAAYGFLMVVGCLFALSKFKKASTSFKKSAKMFLFCGISTMFWGIMFGSYFGDAVDVISEKFFDCQISIKPLWFFPIKQPMKLLGFSLGLGILHIFTGLGIKLYSLIKEKRYKDAVFDVVFWYFLVGGAVIYLVSLKMVCNMLVLDFVLPEAVGMAGFVVAGTGAAGILITSGRESKGFKRILKGIYKLYNVTGYMSDILSYSRLLALGLATGVISGVFNVMAGMVSGFAFGPLWFFIVFLAGHSLNMSINIMGAYVHTNRLQFIEFFGKFYEGGGRKFLPFKSNFKYTAIASPTRDLTGRIYPSSQIRQD
ncbi:MAG: V-type ATP synthase subunit I [Oscillospiraceae bacterium]|nr:V-type ATP synthase subunit I [Oscillospiraceae bacterium]